MIDHKLIRRLEEASFNAWPALNVMLYDGWLLRFANGYTKRANSVNALYRGTLAVDTKIDHCHSVFVRQKLRPTFRLTPLIEPDELDHHLDARDYQFIDHTSVQILDLNKFTPAPAQATANLCGKEGIDEWLRAFHDLNPSRQDIRTHRQILHYILGAICLLIIRERNEIVACGLAVADGDFLGLFDIVTAVGHQRKGYGLEVTSSLLAWGQTMKARYAYLQVMTDNGPAKNLYHKLGFRESYNYWYRLAPNNWRTYE